ncbi:helicase family protein with metal-binding cysteine cluster (plasmid) [Leptolyngbya sp. BL0902]|uniref:DEAD/DEAH box helicase n=1 Tax=Leptolyngbya sp. BL0902 TaxID=1115757 RepID=UPI0018E818BA|nr:DEAD/DEAH box helicase [Leptolyngbya sp. BL0902]QQE67360.1 helicase family protein with metal-binding cysteine cluster [Leptolyngbya sp. BL0902]
MANPNTFADILAATWATPSPDHPPTSFATTPTPPIDIEAVLTAMTQWETTLPGQAPNVQPIPTSVPKALRQALAHIGIDALYSHQVKAYQAIKRGKDLILTPPTAAGKTLAAYIPIIEGALTKGHRCLSLYGLKALASDQEAKLLALQAAMPNAGLTVAKLTGDLQGGDARDAVLADAPHILAMTPDLLHHELRRVYWSNPWQQFMAQLRYVVIDELHAYQGVFGANLCWLIRRLKLVVDKCGGDADQIQFIGLSATVGNPRDLAGRLISRPALNDDGSKNTRLTWLHKSGAKAPDKRLVVTRPSRNINEDTAHLMLQLILAGKQGITFCGSRNATKAITKLLADKATHQGQPHLAHQVASFYGSLDESRRRNIVERLSAGELRWIVATEALEAGIDLPQLDCCILRGFPGNLMSFGQRMGRAGRQNDGLAILVPMGNSLLDAHYSQETELLGSPEAVHFNPDYPVMVAKHLLCAAKEAGFKLNEVEPYFGKAAVPIARLLLTQGELLQRRDGGLYAKGYPHGAVNFRGTISNEQVQLVDASSGQTVETMALPMAHREVHEGAIYQRQDDDGVMGSYKVTQFEQGQATLQPFANPEVSTQPLGQRALVPTQALTEPVQVPLNFGEGHPPGHLTLSLSFGQISQLITDYQILSKRYEPTCLNDACSRFKKPLNGHTHCPSCGKAARMGTVVEVLDTQPLDHHKYTSHFDSPILTATFDTVARGHLEDYARSLKMQLQDHTDRNHYDALWDHPSDLIAIHSLGHQLMLALPLVVLHSQQDLEFLCQEATLGASSGAWFDVSDGGNGATESILRYWNQLVPKAIALVEGCDCVAGCPKCLSQWHCPDHNHALLKQIGLVVLKAAGSK